MSEIVLNTDLLAEAQSRIKFRADGLPAKGQEAWVRILGRCVRLGECWVYTGSIANGYGIARYDGRTQLTHRIVWQALNDTKLVTEQFVCHSCDNPPCCNPAHLWIGTVADNNRDRQAKGRSAPNLTRGNPASAAAARARTHCIRNHEFTQANTRYTPQGLRRCRQCEVIRGERKATTEEGAA